MTWLLAKGTGKPLLEKDMSSRRPGYADYVRRTSGFVPLPPKKHLTPHPQETPVKTIAEGTQAPDFELPDQNGTPVRLSERLADGPVVLFFYPVALTGGCTKRGLPLPRPRRPSSRRPARSASASAPTRSPSRSSSPTSNGFDYPLLSDASGDVARSFGVKRKYITPVKRATFVIDRDRTIRKVITSEMNMNVHADQALARCRAL